MMGLLSTIRGKRDAPVIGSTNVGPIANRDKKLVIQEWPRLLEQQPHLFQIVWNASSTRSNSIKKAFGIGDDESPQENAVFMRLSETIAAFFEKIVITMQLDDDIVRSTCEQLGARHVDFIARGFNSNFWDIFLVCMAETIDETLSSYMTDEGKRAEMILAWQRVFNMVVHHMRTGYNERRKEKLKGCVKP
ncbi:unnamed protein product [Angiostrongylus costaricensis]|uniref:GLOBIN domain-containing protein n=1 Tax=Angiostrongylus costaricensis TaxID=334426 RepID=A0A0R3Q1W4_ANGCS|nr:unnamed protein product [Angiostrongylus costaricensis]